MMDDDSARKVECISLLNRAA